MSATLTQNQKAFLDAYERGAEGMEALSCGLCPGCGECASSFGMSQEEFDTACDLDSITSEAGPSRSPCELCGTGLAGDRETVHGISTDSGELIHLSACLDCVFLLANGTLPDFWEG